MRLLNPNRRLLPNPLHCRLRVQGIVETVTNENGLSLPGFVWVSRFNDVALVAPPDQDWNQWPEYSLADLVATNFNAVGIVRVTGTIDKTVRRYAALTDGTNSVRLFLEDDLVVPRNTRLEVAGFWGRENARTFLRWAIWRPAAGPAKPAEAFITWIAFVPFCK